VVWGSNPGRGEIFHTCSDQPWGPPSLLYNGYWVTPRGKGPGHDVNHPTPSSGEVKERVQLHLYPHFCAFMAGYRINFTLAVLIRVSYL